MKYHPIFNIYNLAQYLWVGEKEIKFFVVCLNICIVHLHSGEEIKVTADNLVLQLNQTRQERAKKEEITISDCNWYYKASSANSGNTYRLDPEINHIKCTCEDYATMSRTFGNKITCKHGYALLNYLGFTSFQDEDYQQLIRELYLISQAESIAEIEEMRSWAWYNDAQHWS